MKCEEALDSLDDLVDGELPEERREALQEHLASCATCRREERRIRSLLDRAASLPRERMPARDLWPGISARITARRRPWATLASRPWALAAAAAVLVALGVVAGRLGGPSAVGPQASLPGARPASVETGHIRDAEKEYARATADLMEALRTRRAALSPETLNAVEANLKTIDEALEELHAALEKDPENRKLTQMLASTHQKKLDLLLRLLKLSSRI